MLNNNRRVTVVVRMPGANRNMSNILCFVRPIQGRLAFIPLPSPDQHRPTFLPLPCPIQGMVIFLPFPGQKTGMVIFLPFPSQNQNFAPLDSETISLLSIPIPIVMLPRPGCVIIRKIVLLMGQKKLIQAGHNQLAVFYSFQPNQLIGKFG